MNNSGLLVYFVLSIKNHPRQGTGMKIISGLTKKSKVLNNTISNSLIDSLQSYGFALTALPPTVGALSLSETVLSSVLTAIVTT